MSPTQRDPLVGYSQALLLADDLPGLVDCLVEALARTLRLDGLRFQPADPNQPDLERGRLSTAQVMHRLSFREHPLGSITLYRDTPCSAEELHLLEDYLALLLAALHNQERLRAARTAARMDSLTGLPNRAAYDEALASELAYCRRHASEMALVVIDLDHFKRINDRLGHLAGDQVLACTAHTLRGILRASDLMFRYGGEEFVALLRHTGIEGGRLWAERARQALHEMETPDRQPISACLGVAACRGEQCAAELFERADRALYRAKADGRNRVEVAAD